MKDSENKDYVNPDHYKRQCSLECIQVIETILGTKGVIDYCLGAAFKYMWRKDHKHETPEEDLDKAKWYIDYADKKVQSLTVVDPVLRSEVDRLKALYNEFRI